MTEENPLKKIRIGTIVPLFEKTVEYIEAILPHGFESFQLSCSLDVLRMDLEEEAERILKLLEGTDAKVSSVFHGANPMGTQEDDANSRELLEKLINGVGYFNADIVAAFTGRMRGKSIPDSIPRYREVWKPLVEKAGEKSVRIAFENCSMGGNWQTGDWNIAHSPAAWELMFDALPNSHVGLEWEPCHQMILLMDPMAQIQEWGHRFHHIHGKDASIYRSVLSKYGIESHHPWHHHRTPGFGDSDWTAIMSELRRVGFEGSIDIEGWHDPVYVNELEMTGQVHALNYLKNCRGGKFVPNPLD